MDQENKAHPYSLPVYARIKSECSNSSIGKGFDPFACSFLAKQNICIIDRDMLAD